MIDIKLDYRFMTIPVFAAINKLLSQLNPSTEIGYKDDIDRFCRALKVDDHSQYKFRYYKGTPEIINLLAEVIPGTTGVYELKKGIPNLRIAVGNIVTEDPSSIKNVVSGLINTELLFFNEDAIEFSDIILRVSINLIGSVSVITYTNYVFPD